MRRSLLAFVLVLAAAIVATSAPAAQTLDITVIDVGQGDAVLIEFPAGETRNRKRMLIDGGPSASTNNAVVRLLNQKGITELDIVALTHPHSDHYVGLTPVLNNFTFKEFWWSGERRGPPRDPNTPDTWTVLQTALRRAGSQVVVQQGDEWSSQGARIEILNGGGEYPDTSSGDDINNDSLVVLLYYEGVKVLFTGDIEVAEGQDLVNDYCNPSRSRCRKLDFILIPGALIDSPFEVQGGTTVPVGLTVPPGSRVDIHLLVQDTSTTGGQLTTLLVDSLEVFCQ